MLTASERPRGVASRIKGRPALVRSLRGLLLRVHRFGRHRARSRQDMQWAAVRIDALDAALLSAEGNHSTVKQGEHTNEHTEAARAVADRAHPNC